LAGYPLGPFTRWREKIIFFYTGIVSAKNSMAFGAIILMD